VQPGRRNVRLTIDRVTPVEHASLSDVVLVVRARDGDGRAMEELVRRHQEDVQRLAAHLLRDPEDARDAAQESLEKLCTRLEQYRGEAQFSTWLHRLVVNTCHDLQQRQGRRRHDELRDDPLCPQAALQVDDPAPGVVEAATSRPALRRALSSLSPSQRRIVVLRDLLAWPYDDIAHELDIPVGTVKSHVHRAHGALRGRLGELRRAG
jgi:RNA polymerase sigma-70 factor (ECF subfamily)